MGAQAEQAEGFLEEVPPPTGPEGQAQPEELVEPPHSGSGRRPILGAPAGPTHVLAEGVGAARWAQADSQLRGRMRVGKATATVRPHLRAVFLTLTLPRQQTEAPLEFTKTNAPTVGSAGRGRAARAGGLQPGLPRVMSGGPGTRSILGPEGSDVTRSPSPGLQARPGPERVGSVSTALLRPPPLHGQKGH